MVIQVFVTILRLEFQQVNVKVSVVEGKVMYAGAELMFDRPGSRIMQMRVCCNYDKNQLPILPALLCVFAEIVPNLIIVP